MLTFCRIWHLSPLQLEELDPWLLEAMVDFTAREQAAARREARRRRG